MPSAAARRRLEDPQHLSCLRDSSREVLTITHTQSSAFSEMRNTRQNLTLSGGQKQGSFWSQSTKQAGNFAPTQPCWRSVVGQTDITVLPRTTNLPPCGHRNARRRFSGAVKTESLVVTFAQFKKREQSLTF